MSTELDVKDDDAVLDFTLDVRKRLVVAMTQNNKFPEDKGDKMVLLSALDGMDRSAMGRKRIKSDENLGDKALQAGQIFAQIISGGLTKSDRTFVVENEVDRAIPTLGHEVDKPVLVEGETAIVAPQMNFESFSAAMQVKHQD